MHAIAWHIRTQDPSRKVIYLSAEKFMYQFIRALRFKDTMAFKEQFRSVDVLMIDDVQFISGKDSTQEEFFHTFNALVDQNRQIVISADKSPSDLEGMEERLKSRLGWGLVADIHPTTYELRLGILQAKAEQMKAAVPTKVLEFLAHKITSNVRELEGALNRIFAHTQLVGRPITLESAQEVLHDLLRANDRRVTIDEIQKRVAEHYNIRLADMHSARRARAVARPRQVAMLLCKQLTPRSLPEIGRKFGGRDHTTVMHAVRKIEELRVERPHHRRGHRAAAPHARDLSAGPGAWRARRSCTHLSGVCAIVPSRSAPAGRRPGRVGVPRGDFAGRAFRPQRAQSPPAMKLTIERSALLRALGHVQSVVERRNTIPILSNVLLRAEDGKLALSATDMDLEMVASVACQVGRKGATTAPAHTLYDIVRKLREGAQVELDAAADKGSMTLRSGRSTFTLACLPPEDYPLMAGGELPHNFMLSAADLKRLIDRTRFAISTEETRYYLNGIYVHAATATTCRCCGRLRPTATGSRAWRFRCPRARPACPASSCRARPWTSCASSSTSSSRTWR